LESTKGVAVSEPSTRPPVEPVPASASGDETEAVEQDAALLETDLLVEEVSIDGMCGVY
jgi:mycofactocin precursor